MRCDFEHSITGPCSKTATKFGIAYSTEFPKDTYYICNRCEKHQFYFYTYYDTPEERDIELVKHKLKEL